MLKAKKGKGGFTVKLCTGVALAMGVLAFSGAQAEVVLQNCNGCSTAQVEALAPLCGQGYAYVSDLVAQNLYKVCYAIDVNDEYRPPRREKVYTWAQPESNVLQTFQAYEGVYLNNGHRMAADVSVHVNIPPATNLHGDNGHMDAYDTVGATANNDAVIKYLMTTYFTSSSVDGTWVPMSPALAAASAELMNKLQVVTPWLTINPNFPINVVVVFSDDSKRTYSFSYSDQKFKAVPGTAHDGHGQLVPENTSMASNGDGTNTYDFTGNGPVYDQPNLQKLLNQFGAQVTGGGGGFVTCSWDGVRNSLTCTVHPY